MNTTATVTTAALAATGAAGSSVGGGTAGGGVMPVPASAVQPASAPAARRVRAYFAPVNRTKNNPAVFDAAQAAGFDLDSPPAPWTDLGFIENFSRSSESVLSPMLAGTPPSVQTQLRQELAATLQFRFVSWGKLQLALSSPSEQFNLLAEQASAIPEASGGMAVPAVYTAAGSTSTTVELTSAAFAVGDIIVVDSDFAKQTGYVGSGASGAYVQSAAQINGDVDYIRRTSLNVARVAGVSGTTLTLDAPLLAGAPPSGYGVQAVTGFLDREGSTFLPEWSALFAIEGEQGDTIFYYYPRLQPMRGASEAQSGLDGPLGMFLLNGIFRALPVTDVRDGAQVLCFRSYIPAGMMAIG